MNNYCLTKASEIKTAAQKKKTKKTLYLTVFHLY